MASSPIVPNADLITFSIKANGSPIKDTYQVVSILVSKEINRIPYCEIEIADGDPASEDFPASDSGDFIPGSKIEVEAGYENNNSLIFSGVVVRQGVNISSQTGPVIQVTCKDESVKMTLGRKNAYFTEKKDSDIMSQLIGNAGVSADVTATTEQLKEVIQYYATDWDFVLNRADINGMVVIPNDGKVAVKKPDELSDEVLGLTYGVDILDLDLEVDAESQFKSVKAYAWDYKGQQVASGEASLENFDIGNLSGDTLAGVVGPDEYALQTYGDVEAGSLTTWAKAQATKSKYAKVKGEVGFQGSALVLPGTLIGLKGVGKRFSGKAFVSGVMHDISNGNWITKAKIGMDREWFSAKVKTEAPIASGLLPGMQGLQLGKVKQINEDPDNEFRVLVTLPLIQSGDDGVWARLSTFYASNGVGAFFYPEVDDEVVVGFFNDDPRYPVILGSMYSSGRAAPETPDEENNTKAFVSREQMKINFDEENKVLTITTPGANQMILSDQDQGITISDQNGNSIKLSPSGIDISSASNINITASEAISMDGPTGISASASGGEMSLSALSISGSADTELSMSASASASFSSSGELSISGAMVMIN